MIRRVLPLVAIAIAANIAMLLSVAANRAGEPDAIVTLTERELQIVPASERDSARELSWYFLPVYSTLNRPWLDARKLTALGFDCRTPLPPASDEGARRERVYGLYRRQLPRRAFAVLEFDGPAWADHVRDLQLQLKEESEAARKGLAERIDLEIRTASRLVPVDASLDAAALRRAYPDRARYLVMPAIVTVITPGRSSRSGTNDVEDVLTGDVRPVTTNLVVPRSMRGVIDAVSPAGASDRYHSYGVPPRYRTTVAFGRRHEPWIVAVEPLTAVAGRQ